MRLRSSIAFSRGLVMPNAPGTIDADYPDEWLAMLRNAGDAPATIAHGERIAQVVLARYATLEWREGEVAITSSRRGGLGSTGTS
jgi:dUTP pyrophosphatase